MRIAVIGTRGTGSARQGVEATLREVCPRLAGRGHDIDIFSERNGRSIAEVAGARLIRLPRVGEAAGHATLAALISACRGYDVVHFCAGESAGLYSLASKLGLRRTVVSVHAFDRPAEETGRPAPLLAPESVAARFADRITVSSRRLERHFRDAYGRGTIYIPYGVARPAPPEATLVEAFDLTPGGYLLLADRLTPDSGAHLAIAALAGRDTPPLVIAETEAGDDDYRRRLWVEADPSKVLFLGRVGRPLLDALMAHAHLFVLPSLAEEPPPTLLDALAHGRAVVVSDEAGFLDVIGPDGFTFTRGDAGDLRRMLAWLAHDGEVVAAMERRAAAIAARRYCWDRIAEAYEQVYTSLF